MPQIINTNVASLNAQRNLNASQADANKALQRLSSGLRINSAKDDAAGLAISNRLTSQINGINQAIRNANDGISVAQVAEGALGETTDILQRIRELSIQSANASNSAADRAALQAEVDELINEVDRIASSTSFGATKLLNGTFSGQQFQVGAQKGETIAVSISGASSDDLGVNAINYTGFDSVQASTAAATPASAVAAQTLTFGVDGVETDLFISAGSSAADIALAVNNDVTGVTATAETTATLTFSAGLDDTTNLSFELNGQQITYTNTSGGAESATVVAAGVSAAIEAAGLANITVSSSAGVVTVTDSTGGDITVDQYAETSTTANPTLTVDAVDADGNAAGDNIAVTGDGTVVTGDVKFSTDRPDATFYAFTDTAGTLTTSTTAAAGVGVAALDTTKQVSDIDISTVAGANDALEILDAALTGIDSQRADLGAIQNRLESVISNLSNVAENSAAARSRIRDADFAEETAALAKSQILQQAGISVLAQANASSQNVLALLQ